MSDLIGKVSQYKQDTRLKRSESLNWSVVKSVKDVQENDSLFTGDQSSAKVELVDKNTVRLEQNSLITLQKRRIILETGSIDLEIKNTPFEIVNSSGSTMISKPGKYKADANSIFEDNGITLLAPLNNTFYVSDKHGEVRFRWESVALNDVYELTIWNQRDVNSKRLFSTNKKDFLITNLEISSLGKGIINWQVKSKITGASSKASFYMGHSSGLSLLQPKDQFVFDMMDSLSVNLSWLNEFTERSVYLQISSTEDFNNLILNEQVTTSTAVNQFFKDEGVYYWRAGVMDDQSSIIWTPSRYFTIRRNQDLKDISLSVPDLLDFGKEYFYKAAINDPNNCHDYLYTLKNNEEVIKKIVTKNLTFQIERINDGEYTLIASCRFNKIIKKETTRHIKVKTTPRLHRPKIIKKKIHLFVELLNLILPSAHAEDTDKPATEKLSWEDCPNKTCSSQIIIIDFNSKKTIIDKIVNGNSFVFQPPYPSIFFWKVRQKTHDQWGEYSDWGEVNAEDKIYQLTDHLMIYPKDEEIITVPIEAKKTPITFQWETPHPDFIYELEVFKAPDEAPIFRIEMSKGSKKLYLKKQDVKIWWRVKAKSRFGNKNLSSKMFSLHLKKSLEMNTPNRFVFPDTVISVGGGPISIRPNQTFNDKVNYDILPSPKIRTFQTTLNLEVRTEPKQNRQNFYNLGLKRLSSNEKGLLFKREEYFATYGHILHVTPRHSQFMHYGLLLNKTFNTVTYTNQFDQASIGGETSSLFLVFKYFYHFNFNDFISLKLAPEIRLRTSFEIDDSLISHIVSPSLIFHFTKKIWLDLYAENERQKDKIVAIKPDKTRSQLLIKNSFFLYGIKLNYIF
ncbi:MAG: hypothetical protein ACOVP4_10865 [Bacteriovoracaceae bacterium]